MLYHHPCFLIPTITYQHCVLKVFGALSVQRRDGHVAFSQMLRPLVVATPDLVFRWGGMASSFAKKMGVIYPGWWFQIFFDFQPYLEKMIQFDEHFSKGLVQPPTSIYMEV